MTGADIAIKALEMNGAKKIFGYPGAAMAPLVDSISRSSIDYILSRNEQGAGHMASGYARVKRTAGVCIATSGPGATNLITAIATAYMDSIPVVAITGQVNTGLIGKDAFQEVDIIGSTLPFTKHSYLVKDVKDISRVINEAFYIATTGRPGPVLVDIPLDVQKTEYEADGEDAINLRGYKLQGKANEPQVRKVAEALMNAKRPVLLAGGGITCSGAVKEINDFVNQTGIPVISTMMGLGVIPTDDKRFYGMIGSHGAKCANVIINRSDLVIAMGTRLGDRSVANTKGLENAKKLVHIDIDPAEIGKNLQPYIPVVGDIKDVVAQLAPMLDGWKSPSDWTAEADELRSASKPVIDGTDNGFVNPRYFLGRLSEITNSDAYLTTEVGQNQLWSANHYTIKNPEGFITSGGFGTMGYGLPAAIGASVAQSEKPVIAVMGDGSFQMDLPEMGTMRQYNIPVKMVLFRNNRLGMVHEHQYLLYNSNYQMVDITDGNPDFAKLVEAYGIPSVTINENSQIDGAINKMLETEGSFMIIAEVSPFEPTGNALNENVINRRSGKEA
ncbi:MAG: biosynthetic-type acetolactate synthase large subunit [Oscillospiraceae bacterium]|nr:biosynthetic-type acetolactate synthase large subunit [Oscillospiraceae bacterium]